MKKIEFYKHNLNNKDKNELLKVLDSLFLTTGDIVYKFENKLSSYTGNKYGVGVKSCTSALFLSLKYFGIGKGDEVITTPLSFIATANSIEFTGAKPIFVDVEEDTGNINIDLIEEKITKKTKAIIPVHLYGHMVDMKKLRKLADKYNLKIIEDCAHCIEGERLGIKPGNLGDAACYSFYATKNITSGEGGAITTNNKEMYDWLKKARLHGMTKNAANRYTEKYEHYDMDFLGYKENMTNIDASLLIHQIDRIDNFLLKKEEISKKYDNGFKNNLKISIPKILKKTKHARHLYTIWVNAAERDKYLEKIQNSGIGIAVNFRPIHLMKYYKNKYGYKRGDFPNAEKIGDSTITIPLYPKLEDQEINYIINNINKIIV